MYTELLELLWRFGWMPKFMRGFLSRFVCSHEGVYMKIPMGLPPPHEVSAWSMSFPEGMAMEIPVVILIPMQIGIHGYSIPAEMRRGRLGRGVAQGAGPALAPSNHPSGLQPIPIEIPMNIHMGNPMEIPCGLWISPYGHSHGDSCGGASSHGDPNGSSIPAEMPMAHAAGPPRARGRPGRGASPGTFEPARKSC